jgi:hypothetical protein
MLHDLSGKVAGLGDAASLVFASPDFRCNVDVRGARYSVRLEPGRYAVSHRVRNNFTRLICEVDVSASRELDIYYQIPKMTVRVHNLPAGTLDGMVYLRDARGNYTGSRVERLEQFDLDFQYVPDLFVNSFNQIGLEVNGREHRFQFQPQIGGTLDIDFSKAQKLDQKA